MAGVGDIDQDGLDDFMIGGSLMMMQEVLQEE